MADSGNDLTLVCIIDQDGVVDRMLHPGRDHHRDSAIRRTEAGVARLLDELAADRQAGDEVWWVQSVPFDPRSLIGDEGVALVRAGRIVRYERLLTY